MNVQRYFLDINSKMDLVPAECGIAGLIIEESDKSDPQYCKFLYQKIGEDFHWKDRLAWSIEQWGDYLSQKNLKFFIAKIGNDVAGFYEYLHHDEKKRSRINLYGNF